MTPDERTELLHDYSDAAHQLVRFSGLYRELTPDEWDALSARLGRAGLVYVEALVDEEFTRLESEKQAKELSYDIAS